MDPTIDHELATHVLHSHMYRNPGETDGEALRIDSSADILITETPDVCFHWVLISYIWLYWMITANIWLITLYYSCNAWLYITTNNWFRMRKSRRRPCTRQRFIEKADELLTRFSLLTSSASSCSTSKTDGSFIISLVRYKQPRSF